MPELKNEYVGNRLQQTVPGAGNPTAAAVPQSSAYGLDPNLLARLVAARQAQQRPAAMPAAYAQAPMRRGADMDEAFTQFMPDPTPKRKEPNMLLREVRENPWSYLPGIDKSNFTTYRPMQIDNQQIEYANTAAPFFDGGRSSAGERAVAASKQEKEMNPFPVPQESEHDVYARKLKRGGYAFANAPEKRT